MGNVKIGDTTLERLRNYLALEHKGKVWGKLTAEIEVSINEHLDRVEKKATKNQET